MRGWPVSSDHSQLLLTLQAKAGFPFLGQHLAPSIKVRQKAADSHLSERLATGIPKQKREQLNSISSHPGMCIKYSLFSKAEKLRQTNWPFLPPTGNTILDIWSNPHVPTPGSSVKFAFAQRRCPRLAQQINSSEK